MARRESLRAPHQGKQRLRRRSEKTRNRTRRNRRRTPSSRPRHPAQSGRGESPRRNKHTAVRRRSGVGREWQWLRSWRGDYIAGRAAGAPLDWNQVPFPTCPTEGLRVQYMRAYQFIRDSKNWFMNVLMGVVCNLIPVIGGIVFTGYLFEVIDSLHEDPDHRDYPDFDFNRFMAYIMRGVWPFLAALAINLVLAVPVVAVVYGVMIAGLLAFRDTPILILLCM